MKKQINFEGKVPSEPKDNLFGEFVSYNGNEVNHSASDMETVSPQQPEFHMKRSVRRRLRREIYLLVGLIAGFSLAMLKERYSR